MCARTPFLGRKAHSRLINSSEVVPSVSGSRLAVNCLSVASMPTDPNELVTAPAQVLAILADPGYVVPDAPQVAAAEQGTVAWLRAHVARFCDGRVHDRRRELVEDELARLDPGPLRAAAAAAAGAELERLAARGD